MTKAVKHALKLAGVPAVRWSDEYGQFFTRIGYRKTKSGNRQRAFWYLGDDEKQAVAQAMVKKTEWAAIKEKSPLGEAVWPSDGKVPAHLTMTDEQLAQARERIEKENTEDATDAEVEWQTPRLTLARVRELYLEYRKGKVGIGGRQGIKQSTCDDEARNLRLALAHMDEQTFINGFGYREIEALKDTMFRKVPSALSERTAINYMRAVKAMLDWAHRDNLIPYRHPADVGDLFRFKKTTSTKIEPYNADKLQTLLKHATDRERLYVYLALNCGYTSAEIGRIKHDEIVRMNGGRTAICRRRDKTSHQNDFEALHVLWPETLRLLKSELAKPNTFNVALLNDADKPLYRFDENGKYDGIKHAYQRLIEKSGVGIAFKQFRKIGSTAMERLGGQQARRLYKAGTIDSGDKVYVLESWENLTPHLDTWGRELRADGVLT